MDSRQRPKRIIGVMSGKGGVGKSTVSALIAKQLKERGYSVGVLDADVTGPSIPRLLNVKGNKIQSSELGILPAITENSIKVMSLNLLLDNEQQPVIWRGPLIAGTVKQFWTDVLWGDLDYLVIDMPPGTGDVALTVMQSIPLDGVVMVSIPQDLVSMIVAKAVNMVRTMNVDVIGVVENMGYIICPDCNKKIRIFDNENTEEFLRKLDLKLLGELPMCRDIANMSKEDLKIQDLELNKVIGDITEKIVSLVNDK
ncbi:Chromosome partitioning ATPase, Mrp family, contains Fe-S cluster [Anaerobranca californiensis DSM 14826]|uniref:Iron-sulfur cluster carrier protein n=1 Tax=Anaerobranca californiensis DSM 14826 TaxID=1120989 RepID=A0A1M6MX57_9FIRM|nr:Mrp/NBP35 family ATP-binding protein [Anaerobranca californiensis]SHJ88002.1 Chromosome partitioning ATPase, Mrp family, contains Fe-S cluster [Anaerobranca californiensis DSM 14826]